ncbi:hypothetical protein CAOG_02171 [Capsaspora owczarzaki ATCC 30864]|uniref:Uncharacterized protein n=1 Tax=Capsaspora owczarzaki (strain ATCC 30864) TaxID=595528 RepID=A0A0D2WLT1_CAPO3|nr:hypothetical protein CAOG_02171 [Capsaspora owczarzaki ATCC 30864]KJE90948.1 hypothetical protein CAOG_002171 [Capsaspora owczarzaki ATCC 30864]|eukprot:XP_004348921.1 hypothetical protein CAOG_02171 [Capsaspora owczarzaki ATCC 30864]
MEPIKTAVLPSDAAIPMDVDEAPRRQIASDTQAQDGLPVGANAHQPFPANLQHGVLGDPSLTIAPPATAPHGPGDGTHGTSGGSQMDPHAAARELFKLESLHGQPDFSVLGLASTGDAEHKPMAGQDTPQVTSKQGHTQLVHSAMSHAMVTSIPAPEPASSFSRGQVDHENASPASVDRQAASSATLSSVKLTNSEPMAVEPAAAGTHGGQARPEPLADQPPSLSSSPPRKRAAEEPPSSASPPPPSKVRLSEDDAATHTGEPATSSTAATTTPQPAHSPPSDASSSKAGLILLNHKDKQQQIGGNQSQESEPQAEHDLLSSIATSSTASSTSAPPAAAVTRSGRVVKKKHYDNADGAESDSDAVEGSKAPSAPAGGSRRRTAAKSSKSQEKESVAEGEEPSPATSTLAQAPAPTSSLPADVAAGAGSAVSMPATSTEAPRSRSGRILKPTEAASLNDSGEAAKAFKAATQPISAANPATRSRPRSARAGAAATEHDATTTVNAHEIANDNEVSAAPSQVTVTGSTTPPVVVAMDTRLDGGLQVPPRLLDLSSQEDPNSFLLDTSAEAPEDSSNDPVDRSSSAFELGIFPLDSAMIMSGGPRSSSSASSSVNGTSHSAKSPFASNPVLTLPPALAASPSEHGSALATSADSNNESASVASPGTGQLSSADKRRLTMQKREESKEYKRQWARVHREAAKKRKELERAAAASANGEDGPAAADDDPTTTSTTTSTTSTTTTTTTTTTLTGALFDGAPADDSANPGSSEDGDAASRRRSTRARTTTRQFPEPSKAGNDEEEDGDEGRNAGSDAEAGSHRLRGRGDQTWDVPASLRRRSVNASGTEDAGRSAGRRGARPTELQSLMGADTPDNNGSAEAGNQASAMVIDKREAERDDGGPSSGPRSRAAASEPASAKGQPGNEGNSGAKRQRARRRERDDSDFEDGPPREQTDDSVLGRLAKSGVVVGPRGANGARAEDDESRAPKPRGRHAAAASRASAAAQLARTPQPHLLPTPADSAEFDGAAALLKIASAGPRPVPSEPIQAFQVDQLVLQRRHLPPHPTYMLGPSALDPLAVRVAEIRFRQCMLSLSDQLWAQAAALRAEEERDKSHNINPADLADAPNEPAREEDTLIRPAGEANDLPVFDRPPSLAVAPISS